MASQRSSLATSRRKARWRVRASSRNTPSIELVTAKAQGNPFYIEELLNFIRSQGVDLRNESALQELQLPASLHSLILSRIDTLDESPRRTLKVASVPGRVFRAPMLPAAYPELGGPVDVEEYLRVLGSADLVHVEPEHPPVVVVPDRSRAAFAYYAPYTAVEKVRDQLETFGRSAKDAASDETLTTLRMHSIPAAASFSAAAKKCGAAVPTWLREGIPYVTEVCERTRNDRKGGHLGVRRSDGRLVLRDSAMVAEGEDHFFVVPKVVE